MNEAQRNGAIAAAVITALGGIVAAAISLVAAGGSADPDPVAGGSPTAVDQAPAESQPADAEGRCEAADSSPDADEGALDHFVWDGGANLTLCGLYFDADERVTLSWVPRGIDGEAFDSVPFDRQPRANEQGGFHAVDQEVPDWPDGTATVEVHAVGLSSEKEASIDVPYDIDARRIYRDESG